MGLDGYGIGYERQDYNEYNDPITPELRAIDGVDPFDETFKNARDAGITTVCTGPGSSNVIGGNFVALKTVGDRAGFIEVGKDGDILITKGDLFDIEHEVVNVYIDGVKVN